MEERILKAYEDRPKGWLFELACAVVVVALLVWSGSAVEASGTGQDGGQIALNILAGIAHPDTSLHFNLTTGGVPYLLVETICIAFLGTVLAISALFVSVVAFSAVLVVGAVAAGWLWWKTRDVRRQLRGEMERMQQAMERGAPFEPGSPLNRGGRGGGQGDVIEGDFIREAPADRQDRAETTAGNRTN